jgi:transposase
MDAYSQDLRERVVRACDEGAMSQPEVAAAFGVSLSFITKLLRRRAQTGSVAVLPHAGGRRALLQAQDQKQLAALVQAQPDATLAELCQRLKEHDSPKVSKPTMCRALQTLRLVRKKRLCTPVSATRRGFKSSGVNLSGKSPRLPLRDW